MPDEPSDRPKRTESVPPREAHESDRAGAHHTSLAEHLSDVWEIAKVALREALLTPIHAAAPAGHNNRVLRARLTLVATVATVAVLVAAVGAWAVRYPTVALATGAVSVVAVVAFLALKLAERLGLVGPPHGTDPLSPFTKVNRPS